MKYVTGIEKFEQFIKVREEGGANNMYDPFEDAEKRGEARGQAIGEARGKEAVICLMKKLYAAGRDEDAKRATTDEEYLDQLLKEFAIQ